VRLHIAGMLSPADGGGLNSCFPSWSPRPEAGWSCVLCSIACFYCVPTVQHSMLLLCAYCVLSLRPARHSTSGQHQFAFIYLLVPGQSNLSRVMFSYLVYRKTCNMQPHGLDNYIIDSGRPAHGCYLYDARCYTHKSFIYSVCKHFFFVLFLSPF
jgi:hypothetical protein